MLDKARAFLSPSSIFKHPKDVMQHQELNREEKYKILKQWEYDVRELLTATEENMVGDSEEIGQLLSEIEIGLMTLDDQTN